MRNIYKIGSQVTQIVLIFGIILMVIGGFAAYGGLTTLGLSLLGVGASLALSSLSLSLLVYLGMDVYAIRLSLVPEDEEEDEEEEDSDAEDDALPDNQDQSATPPNSDN